MSNPSLSTFLIKSSKNNNFGTGFCVHKDKNGSFLVTCAHVVNTCDKENLIIGSYKVTLLHISKKEEIIDLALLYVEGLTNTVTLQLSEEKAEKEDGFKLNGYRLHKKSYAQEPLTGAIKKSYTLESNQKKQWIYELSIHNDDNIKEGYSGSAVVSSQTGLVMAVATDRKQDGKNAYAIPIHYLKEIWQEIPQNLFISNENTNPYKGLHSFTYDDRYNYYGREKESKEIANQLKNNRLFTLLGASGSGKSSLIFAGILPLIEEEEVQILSLRPQSDPFKSLATVFIPTLYTDQLERLRKEKELSNDLRKNSICLSQLSEHFLEKTHTKKLYLIIDQFEEIFSLVKESTERNLFYNKLLELINSEVNITLLIAMRADFMGYLSYYEPFNQAYNSHPNSVLSLLDKTNLQKVIEQPALSQGVTFQDGLINRIIDEIENEAGQLPLLEFALDQLWEHKKARVITHENLNIMTNISHSISHYADSIYAKSSDKKSIKKVLIKLVNPGSGTEDTRRIASLDEFDKEDRETIVHLADKRLIVTNDNKIDIVHEALIREWKQLQEWIEEYREFLEWEKRLKIDQKIYEENGSKKEDLLKESRLLKAEEFLLSHEKYISPKDRTFIKSSKNQAKQRSFIRKLVVVTIVSVSLGTSFFMLQLYKKSEYSLKKEQEATRLALEEKEKATQAEKVASDSLEKEQKSRRLADEKTKSLTTLTQTTINSLIRINEESSVKQYIKDVLKSGEMEVFKKMVTPLIVKSRSMNDKERNYWNQVLPVMTSEQSAELLEILLTEGMKLRKIYNVPRKANHLKEHSY